MGCSHSNGRAVIHMAGQNGKVSVDGTAGYALYLAVKYISVLLLLLFCFFVYIINGARKQEAALRDVIAFAV